MAEVNKIVIKKYPNRRLYNMQSSQYVTLEDIFVLIKNGNDVTVVDSKGKEDLTRATLTQIILEQEIKGYPLLPTEFLQMIIRLYDHPAMASWQQGLCFFMDHWQKIIEKKSFLPMPDFTKYMEEFINLLGGKNNNDKKS